MEVTRSGQGGPIVLTSSSFDGQNRQNVDNSETNSNPVPEKKDNKEEDVKKAVDKLNKFLDDNGTYAEYSVHEKFKEVIMIKIIDKKTKEVIREIPPKKILDMVAKMCEMVGILIDKKA